MAKGLTPKQKRFCEEYLIDLNATQSYIRAGYSAKSDTIAASEAYKLLRKPHIAEYISECRQNLQKRTETSADKVIAELSHVAFARMSRIVKVNNSVTEIVDFDNLPEAELAAIASVKTRQIVSEDREIFDTEIKMHSKTKALELLMKHFGLFADEKVSVKVDEAVATQHNQFFEKIMADGAISEDAKRRMLQHAVNLGAEYSKALVN